MARRSSARPLPIFGAFGILFVAMAWTLFLWPEDKLSVVEVLANTLLLVGFAILTVVILQLLWSAFGGDPVQRSIDRLAESATLLEDSRTTGVRRMLTKSGTFGSDSDWLAELSAARRNGTVDLMGYTLVSWLQGDFEECVLELLDRGVTVRALFMSITNSVFGRPDNEIIATEQPAKLCADCLAAEAVFRRLTETAATRKGSFQARQVHTGSIKCSLTRVDRRIIAIPYLYSVPASNSLLMVIGDVEERTTLYSLFTREFDTLWADACSAPLSLDPAATNESAPREPAEPAEPAER